MTTTTKEYEVGRRVHLVLKSKTTIDGVVFAVDAAGSRVILEETIPGAPSGLRDTRVVNLAAVESATFEETKTELEPLTSVTKEQALRREKASFRGHEEALLRSGPGQEIPDTLSRVLFENFSKTYDCRWNEREKKIEIPDIGVTIKHPFRSSDVSGRDMRAVKRVKELIAKMHHPK